METQPGRIVAWSGLFCAFLLDDLCEIKTALFFISALQHEGEESFIVASCMKHSRFIGLSGYTTASVAATVLRCYGTVFTDRGRDKKARMSYDQ